MKSSVLKKIGCVPLCFGLGLWACQSVHLRGGIEFIGENIQISIIVEIKNCRCTGASHAAHNAIPIAHANDETRMALIKERLAFRPLLIEPLAINGKKIIDNITVYPWLNPQPMFGVSKVVSPPD